MIELDDPIWAELRHCYGSGEGIPEQIRYIERADRPSPDFWDDLGNTLCHQCTVGTASYAAFPHLVRIAAQNAGNQKGFASLLLASEILAFTLGPKKELPPMDGVLALPFAEAIKAGQELIASMLFDRERDFYDCMELLAIAGAFAAHADIFLLLNVLREGWFDCPACDEVIETDRLYTF